MPLDVPGRTRATMIIAVSISFKFTNTASASPAVLHFIHVASVVVSLRAVKPALKVQRVIN